jgi:Tat protein translocase TatB subunit
VENKVFLFIFESIGTSELILIGIVALIFLGPRKLPQIAKTIGKTMAEFRSATNEFKTTWQREVDFEEEAEAIRTGNLPAADPEPIPRENSILNTEVSDNLAAPEIKLIDKERFNELAPAEKVEEPAESAPTVNELSDKRSWL